ncbi:MAG: amidohydrolase family protein [Bryobacterales bacterium]|nr:amidohydrolase family protein [Bryobacterales bacterium]
MKTLIDVHSHLGQSTNAAMSANGERLCELAREAGITHSVAFSIEACYGGLDAGNRLAVEEAASQQVLSIMVVAHPNHLESSRRWVEQARANSKIVGIKLHPVLGNYDILSGTVYRLFEEVVVPSGLPVLSHVGNESPNVTIDKYLRLAAAFPQVRFIAAHLGVGLLGLADAAVDAWKANPQENVWFDMGTLRAFYTGAVENLLHVVGPDRVCFGTDSPLYLPAPFTRVLELLPISEEVREKIAWRNALQVIPLLKRRPGVPAE